MKRIVLGVLLEIIAVIALMIAVVVPSVMDLKDVPGMNNLFEDVLCRTPEILHVERHVYSYRPGETSYSATFYCINETRERDVTGEATLIGIAIFVVPLLLGIFLIISGAMAAKRRALVTMGVYDLSGMGVNNIISSMSNMGEARGSTTERLKALKQAYDQGLITESEYETKRQSILSEM